MYYVRQYRCSTSVRSIPYSWFCIVKPTRLARNSRGGSIMLLKRNNIALRLLKNNIVAFFVEINLRQKKWLICCGYNPSKSSIENFKHNIGKTLDSDVRIYDNFLVDENFNSEIFKSSLHEHEFYSIYNLHNLCDKATCYKNPEDPSCTDLFLTNSPRSFRNIQIIETRLSDFHRLLATVLKMYLPIDQPKVITYKDYKNFDNKCFLEEFQLELDVLGSLAKYVEIFQNVCIKVLDKYAPKNKNMFRLTKLTLWILN